MLKYSKFIVAIAVAILQATLAATTGDHNINPVEGFAIAIAAVNAVLVVLVPNLPYGIAAWAKSIAASLMAALLVGAQLILDNVIDSTDIVQMVVAAAGAAGIWLVPNNSAPSQPASHAASESP